MSELKRPPAALMIWLGVDFWPRQDAAYMFLGSLAAICIGSLFPAHLSS